MSPCRLWVEGALHCLYPGFLEGVEAYDKDAATDDGGLRFYAQELQAQPGDIPRGTETRSDLVPEVAVLQSKKTCSGASRFPHTRHPATQGGKKPRSC